MSGCPRCGCEDLSTLSGFSAGCEWIQFLCDDCEHRWGDGRPDSQDRPLPTGFEDCRYCEGEGEPLGCRCKVCRGEGIIPR